MADKLGKAELKKPWILDVELAKSLPAGYGKIKSRDGSYCAWGAVCAGIFGPHFDYSLANKFTERVMTPVLERYPKLEPIVFDKEAVLSPRLKELRDKWVDVITQAAVELDLVRVHGLPTK